MSLRSRFLSLSYIACFSFSSNDNDITIFVGYTSVTGSRIRPVDSLNFNFLPKCYVLVSNFLNYPDRIYIIKENFVSTLPTIYVDFVVYYAATVRVTCLGYVSNLFTFKPSK